YYQLKFGQPLYNPIKRFQPNVLFSLLCLSFSFYVVMSITDWKFPIEGSKTTSIDILETVIQFIELFVCQFVFAVFTIAGNCVKNTKAKSIKIVMS
ncbi:hypothetical protein MXB_3240, partial [Myxobolus squamalis]